jgi:hypothetical protein
MVHLVSISPATGDAQNIALGRVVKPIFDDISKYVNACNGIQTASDLSKSTEIVRRALGMQLGLTRCFSLTFCIDFSPRIQIEFRTCFPRLI